MLQGLIVCGHCGRRLTLRYHSRRGRLCPEYVCQRKGIENAEPLCLRVPGQAVDQTVSDLLLELVNPLTLEVALAVQQELQSRIEEADRLRKQQVQRARYEAELAQRRYLRVDPENRLVADSLEADWNAKLRALAEAQQDYEHRREQDRRIFSEEQRQAILALATDFPRLWRDPNTPDRERKRMVRLLIEDVTLLRASKQIQLHLRFRGGADQTLTLANPLRAWELRMTSSEVVSEIDKLLDEHTYGEIAAILNERGRRSGTGQRFTARYIARIQLRYGLKPRYDRLRDKGLLTLEEMAQALKVHPKTVKTWASHGMLHRHAYTDKLDCLYQPTGKNAPRKAQGMKLSQRTPFMSECSEEVQCEA